MLDHAMLGFTPGENFIQAIFYQTHFYLEKVKFNSRLLYNHLKFLYDKAS